MSRGAGRVAVAGVLGGIGVALLAGCGGLPDEPTVTGVVTGVVAGGSPQLTEPSDPYYDRIPLGRLGAEYRDASGASIEVSDLRDGDAVAVWIGDGCAESFPVQCDLVAVHVTE